MFLGNQITSTKAYSEETANEIDEEVKRIVEEAYDAAMTILEEHREQLTAVAQGLLAIETLDGDQFVALFDGSMTPEELAEEQRVMQEERKAKDKQEAKAAIRQRKLKQKQEMEEAERKKQEALDELTEMIEEQGKNARFKPKVMTYNDMTNKAEPVEKEEVKAEDTEDESNS